MSFYETAVGAMAPLVKLYHRLDAAGLENLPPEGQGFILAPNHTHWFGYDAFVISCAMRGRKVRWLSWSYEDEMPLWDKLVGSFDAILYNKSKPFPYEELSRDVLGAGGIVGIFPEGNNNTMKDWYRLRPFFPGCVRLAAMSSAPVVPVAVAGIEETSPIFTAKENIGEPITDIVALPLILPTKIHIRFGEPMRVQLSPDERNDRSALDRESARIQQAVLDMLKEYRPKARADKW